MSREVGAAAAASPVACIPGGELCGDCQSPPFGHRVSGGDQARECRRERRVEAASCGSDVRALSLGRRQTGRINRAAAGGYMKALPWRQPNWFPPEKPEQTNRGQESGC